MIKNNEPNWIAVEPGKLASAIDELTVAFIKQPNGNYKAAIRVGGLLLKKLGWKNTDKLGVFYDEDDHYHWMLCKATHGYKLSAESTTATLRINMTWNKPGVTYTRSKKTDFVLHKDKITFRVPV